MSINIRQIIRFFLLIAVFILLNFAQVGIISNLIIVYLLASLFWGWEVRSVFYGGIFLLCFNFLSVYFRHTAEFDLLKYSKIVIWGSIIIFLIRNLFNSFHNEDFLTCNFNKNNINEKIKFWQQLSSANIYSFCNSIKKIVRQENIAINRFEVIFKSFVEIFKKKKIIKCDYLFIIKIIFLISLLISLLVLSQLTIYNILIWVFFVGGLLFGWDSRIAISIALFFLISCPYYLITKQPELAESAAIYAYYFLAIGAIEAIFEVKRHGTPVVDNFSKKLFAFFQKR